MNLLLAVELLMRFNPITVSREEDSFSDLTSILVYSLAGLLVLQYLSTTCVGFIRKVFDGIKLLCHRTKKRPKKILKIKKSSVSA